MYEAHAKLSASGSERWLNCPASVGLSELAPEPPTNKWAIEGTNAHGHLERALTELSHGYIGVKVEPELLDNDDMRAAVKFAFKFIRKRLMYNGIRMAVEEKLDLTFIGPKMFGTADIQLIAMFDKLEVWDYKHGKGIAVDVVKESAGFDLNTQLLYYALAAAYKYGFNFKEVTIGVIQPRADHILGPTRSVTIPIKKLMSYIPMFKEGVERVNAPNVKVNAGEWCHWCPAKDHNCPAHQQIREEKINNMFDDCSLAF